MAELALQCIGTPKSSSLAESQQEFHQVQHHDLTQMRENLGFFFFMQTEHVTTHSGFPFCLECSGVFKFLPRQGFVFRKW
jgi:hypothetical protein